MSLFKDLNVTTNLTMGTTGTFRLSRLTKAARDALSASDGDVIFNTDTKKLNVYDGVNWYNIGPTSESLTCQQTDHGFTTISAPDVSGGSPPATEWVGGVLGPNGKIYGIPYSAGNVLIIDTKNNSTSLIPVTGTGWVGGVLAPNGKIFGIPIAGSNILIIDTFDDSISYLAVTGTGWLSGALAPNGKIYCVPYSATTVAIIDTNNDTADTTSITGLTGFNNWFGSVLAPNGKIYCVPYNATTVLIIETDSSTKPTCRHLSAYYNKL